MTDLRTAVLERLADLEWTPADVAKAAGVTCHWTTVHRWLSGAHDLRSEHVSEILGVVGLTIRPARRHRRTPPPRRA